MEDFVDISFYSMECQNDASSCSSYIHPDCELHLRLTTDSSRTIYWQVTQNGQLRITLSVIKMPADSEAIRAPLQTESSITHLTHAKELPSYFPDSQQGCWTPRPQSGLPNGRSFLELRTAINIWLKHQKVLLGEMEYKLRK